MEFLFLLDEDMNHWGRGMSTKMKGREKRRGKAKQSKGGE